MIVRQVSPWGAGWSTPTAAVAQMRRDMLMDRTLWARFGEAALRAQHAIQWLVPCVK